MPPGGQSECGIGGHQDCPFGKRGCEIEAVVDGLVQIERYRLRGNDVLRAREQVNGSSQDRSETSASVIAGQDPAAHLCPKDVRAFDCQEVRRCKRLSEQ